MPSATVLRVKRRRDDPAPPETFQLETDGSSSMNRFKRARKQVDAQIHVLSGLLQNKASLDQRSEMKDGGHDEAKFSSNHIGASDNNAFESTVEKPGKEYHSIKAIVFKKVSTPDLESEVVSNKTSSVSRMNKRKASSEQYNSKMASVVQNRVNVVEATLDSMDLPCRGVKYTDEKLGTKPGDSDSKSAIDDSIESGVRVKRSRVGLKLVESRTMTEGEFWKRQKEQDQALSPTYNSPVDNPWMSATYSNSPSPLKLGKSGYRNRMRRLADGSESKPKPRTSSPSKILHPLAQMIETSLVSLHSNPTLSNLSKHLSLVESNASSSNELEKWLNYQSNTLGTLLHVLALGNGIDAIRHLLTERGGNLEWKKDNDGRTPLDIAVMINAESIVDCFKSWDKCKSRDEEDDYVYDVYYLHQEETESDEAGFGYLDNANGECSSSRGEGDGLEVRQEPQSRMCTGSLSDEDHDVAPQDGSKKEFTAREEPVVVMRGGVGYWNKEGELILKVVDDEDIDDSDYNDEEYDSNCESFEGNDYPDADSSVEEGVNRYYTPFGLDEDYGYRFSAKGDQANGINSRTYDLTNSTDYLRNEGSDSDDDEESDYRGAMYGIKSHWTNESMHCEREEAYDSEVDDE